MSASEVPEPAAAEFGAELTALVPGLASVIGADGPTPTPLGLDLVQRVLLRRALRDLGGDLPPELVESAATVTELYEWIAVRRANGSAESDVAVQSAGRGRVALRPLEPQDVPALYRAALDPGSSHRWRFRGATPSLQQFTEALTQGVLAQFSVTDSVSNTLHGLVVLYNAAIEHGWAYIGFQRCASFEERAGEMTIGLLLLIDHAFAHWPFHKLYAELPADNYRQLVRGLAGDLVVQEACFREHIFYDGSRSELYVVAIYRDRWLRFTNEWPSLFSSS
jgi:RimJ/RimL family protein N-acetyltransferase